MIWLKARPSGAPEGRAAELRQSVVKAPSQSGASSGTSVVASASAVHRSHSGSAPSSLFPGGGRG